MRGTIRRERLGTLASMLSTPAGPPHPPPVPPQDSSLSLPLDPPASSRSTPGVKAAILFATTSRPVDSFTGFRCTYKRRKRGGNYKENLLLLGTFPLAGEIPRT